MKDLAVIIPVYNEEDAIGTVLDKWILEMDKLGIDYTIIPYNDGSKDGSWDVIQKKQEQYSGKIVGHNKTNSGHGPTILQGYREASDAGYEWIFQIDSDDEMGPEGFAGLWKLREQYDFLVGTRDGRKQLLPRKIISAISRLSVRLFYGRSIWDVNTPYRLMRTSAFCEVYRQIPSDTFAPNVVLSGMAAKMKLRCYEANVPQHDRTTGEVSIKKWKLLKAAMQSFFQTVFFAMNQKPSIVTIFFLSGLIAFLPLRVTSSFGELLLQGVYSETDASVFLTIAKEFLHGALPYRDFFDHKGLYIYFIDALGLLTNMALIEWFCFALTAMILYNILLLLVRPRMALLFLFLGFLLLRNKYLTSGNMTEEYLLPALSIGLFYFISFIKKKRTVSYLQTVLLGMAFGWMLMLKFNYVSIFVAVCFYMIVSLCSRKQYSAMLYVIICGLIGVLLSLLPSIIFFWKHNLFSYFFDAYVLFNMEYAGKNFFSISRLYRLIEFPEILLLPWFSWFVLAFNRKKCNNEDKAIILFITTILLLDFVFIWSSRRIYEHYLLPSHLLVVISLALTFKYTDSFVLSMLYRIKHSKRTFYRLAPEFTCLICVILLVFFLVFNVSNHINEVKKNMKSRQRDERVCSLLKKHNNKMIVVGNSCVYYRIYNATPDSKFLYQKPICNISKRIQKQYIKEICMKKPRLFLLPRGNVIPEYYGDFFQEQYSPMECLNGTLFIRSIEE